MPKSSFKLIVIVAKVAFFPIVPLCVFNSVIENSKHLNKQLSLFFSELFVMGSELVGFRNLAGLAEG